MEEKEKKTAARGSNDDVRRAYIDLSRLDERRTGHQELCEHTASLRKNNIVIVRK